MWAVVFELTVMIPFLASWYAIFLLPKIWNSNQQTYRKSIMTAFLIVLIPIIITITDTIARYALETDVLREFAALLDISL